MADFSRTVTQTVTDSDGVFTLTANPPVINYNVQADDGSRIAVRLPLNDAIPDTAERSQFIATVRAAVRRLLEAQGF